MIREYSIYITGNAFIKEGVVQLNRGSLHCDLYAK